MRVVQKVLEHLLRELGRHRDGLEGGERHDAGERALELTYVRDDPLGQKVDHGRGHRYVLRLRFRAEDGNARLEIGSRDVRDETPFETRAQPVLELGDGLWRSVTRHDDLLALFVDRVERVEELLLRALLAGDELDVVDEEDIDTAVAFAELLALLRTDRVDELVRELFAGRVRDALLRVARDHRVSDRVHQMRLAESRAAVDEERVVAVARPLGHRQGSSVRETVVRAHHEGGEGVARVQKSAGIAPLLPARLLARPRGRRRHPRGGAGACARRGSAGGRNEADVDGASEKVLQRGTHLRSELALQPLARERVGYPNEEDVVLFGEDLCVLEPGVVLRARKPDLQLAEGGRPKLFEVQRLPFSSLVQQNAPHKTVAR